MEPLHLRLQNITLYLEITYIVKEFISEVTSCLMNDPQPVLKALNSPKGDDTCPANVKQPDTISAKKVPVLNKTQLFTFLPPLYSCHLSR